MTIQQKFGNCLITAVCSGVAIMLASHGWWELTGISVAFAVFAALTNLSLRD